MTNFPRSIPTYDPGLLVKWGEDCWLGEYASLGMRPMSNAANRRLIERGTPKPVYIGSRSIIGTHCTIYHDVYMGEDCRVGDHATIREGTRIGARCIIGTNADIQYGCLIADDVRIMNGAHISGGTMIGAGSFIGPGVMTANDRHVDLDDYRDKGDRAAPIFGKKVMVGAGASIAPGVTVGDGALIAMGAIVVKDVPAGAIVKGVAAMQISLADYIAEVHELIHSGGR